MSATLFFICENKMADEESLIDEAIRRANEERAAGVTPHSSSMREVLFVPPHDASDGISPEERETICRWVESLPISIGFSDRDAGAIKALGRGFVSIAQIEEAIAKYRRTHSLGLGPPGFGERVQFFVPRSGDMGVYESLQLQKQVTFVWAYGNATTHSGEARAPSTKPRSPN